MYGNNDNVLIVLRKTAVFWKPESNTRRPLSHSSSSRSSGPGAALRSLKAVAGMELLTMGTLMALPVRFCRTNTVSCHIFNPRLAAALDPNDPVPGILAVQTHVNNRQALFFCAVLWQDAFINCSAHVCNSATWSIRKEILLSLCKCKLVSHFQPETPLKSGRASM